MEDCELCEEVLSKEDVYSCVNCSKLVCKYCAEEGDMIATYKYGFGYGSERDYDRDYEPEARDLEHREMLCTKCYEKQYCCQGTLKVCNKCNFINLLLYSCKRCRRDFCKACIASRQVSFNMNKQICIQCQCCDCSRLGETKCMICCGLLCSECQCSASVNCVEKLFEENKKLKRELKDR